MFRIGQRVKRIANPGNPSLGPKPDQEGIVSEFREGLVWVAFDAPYPWFCGQRANPYGCRPETLAPLTDPKAEQFIASLEKLGNEPVAPALPVKERA